MWVDRTGLKVGVTEQYSRSSKGSLALVAQVRPRPRSCPACAGAGSARAARLARLHAWRVGGGAAPAGAFLD